MNTQTKFQFSEPLFYDGIAWNYIKYDPNHDKMEVNIMVNSKKIPESYLEFFNFLDKNVTVKVENDELHLEYDKGNCKVVITVEEKNRIFYRKKYLRSVYKYYPKNIEHIYLPVLKHKMILTGNKKWDILANFVNQIF